MDAATIKTIAVDIRASVDRGIPHDTLKKANADFAERFPKLFDACCNSNFDLNHLDFMLQTMKGLLDKKIDPDIANEQVYGRLKEQYIDPIEAKL